MVKSSGTELTGALECSGNQNSLQRLVPDRSQFNGRPRGHVQG